MSDAWGNLEKYTWFQPEDVIIIHADDFEVIAYGIPGDTPGDEPEEEAEGDETLLPKPRHDSDAHGCLGCDWNNLRARIKKAAGDE